MTDLDRETALALIAGRLGDYPIIRRLPDGRGRYAVRRAFLDEKTCDFCRMTDGAPGPIPPVDCEHEADAESEVGCRCVMVEFIPPVAP